MSVFGTNAVVLPVGNSDRSRRVNVKMRAEDSPLC